MKRLKRLVPIILAAAAVVGLLWLTLKAAYETGWRDGATYALRAADSPWDPGDERDPHPKPNPKNVYASFGRSVIKSESRGDGDKPWDPGDERRVRKGAERV